MISGALYQRVATYPVISSSVWRARPKSKIYTSQNTFTYWHSSTHCTLNDTSQNTSTYWHSSTHCTLNDTSQNTFTYWHSSTHCTLNDAWHQCMYVSMMTGTHTHHSTLPKPHHLCTVLYCTVLHCTVLSVVNVVIVNTCLYVTLSSQSSFTAMLLGFKSYTLTTIIIIIIIINILTSLVRVKLTCSQQPDKIIILLLLW